MSRKGIAERLQMARRSNERLDYNWWREIYIQDVSKLLHKARALAQACALEEINRQAKERKVERLSKRLEKCHQVARDALNDAEGQPTVVAEPEYKDALDYIEALAARRSQQEERRG